MENEELNKRLNELKKDLKNHYAEIYEFDVICDRYFKMNFPYAKLIIQGEK